ncbi:hypothetical protein D3C83_146990 [compost metagenome]
MLEDGRFSENVLVLWRHIHLLGRNREHLIPDAPIAVGDQQPADAAAHAVANNHHLLL